MQAVVRKNALPGFDLALEQGKGEPLLRMIRRNATDATGELPAAVPPAREDAAGSGTAGTGAASAGRNAPPVLPLFQARPAQARRVISDETLTRIRRDFPGWDLSELQSEFDTWLTGDESRAPANYDAAFYGFVRQHHARRA
jgi:hypothetical protein